MYEKVKVIMLPTSRVELNKIRSLIENKIQHMYIDKNIGKPAIDEIKIALLYTIMKQSELSEPKIEQYILSTMLVQMALDTHEIVPLKNDNTESSLNQKKLQLKVLAGDYYSGLYYSLLAETEDFPVIHILATAIKEINEFKMKLYYNRINSFDEAIYLLMKIESLLITRMINHVIELPDKGVVGNIIILNRLLLEKKVVANNENSSLFQGLKELFLDGRKLDIETRVDEIIQEKVADIEKSIAVLPFDTHLTIILQDILEDNTSIAKEG